MIARSTPIHPESTPLERCDGCVARATLFLWHPVERQRPAPIIAVGSSRVASSAVVPMAMLTEVPKTLLSLAIALVVLFGVGCSSREGEAPPGNGAPPTTNSDSVPDQPVTHEDLIAILRAEIEALAQAHPDRTGLASVSFSPPILLEDLEQLIQDAHGPTIMVVWAQRPLRLGVMLSAESGDDDGLGMEEIRQKLGDLSFYEGQLADYEDACRLSPSYCLDRDGSRRRELSQVLATAGATEIVGVALRGRLADLNAIWLLEPRTYAIEREAGDTVTGTLLVPETRLERWMP